MRKINQLFLLASPFSVHPHSSKFARHAYQIKMVNSCERRKKYSTAQRKGSTCLSLLGPGALARAVECDRLPLLTHLGCPAVALAPLLVQRKFHEY